MDNSLLLLGDIVFDAKPDAVPYNCRISYKVTQLCLMLHLCGWSNSCSLVKIQMISHALISKENMDRLVAFSEGVGMVPIVRFDPTVNRALMFTIGYGLVTQQKSGKYKLTTHGEHFAKQILIAGDLMCVEIAEMKRISKKITEKQIQEIEKQWRFRYDTD